MEEDRIPALNQMNSDVQYLLLCVTVEKSVREAVSQLCTVEAPPSVPPIYQHLGEAPCKRGVLITWEVWCKAAL